MGDSLPTAVSRPRRLTRRLAAACAAGLVLTAPGVAVADSRPFATSPGAAQAPKTATPAPGGPVQAARLKAKAAGKPVTVDELTTETSLTVAQPDGKLTLTTNVLPARVKKNGTWAAVDAKLSKNKDGSLSPATTPSGVSLSAAAAARWPP
ncbi:hypothetical protein BX265_7119 [Streptomyces sp. TLI_235]|nr:hypothetical protein [Streptomyces sp. TLI_235]PBC69766.1 hypothetical protein BX265_7119 [Streptomyces sp. TLI_235]